MIRLDYLRKRSKVMHGWCLSCLWIVSMTTMALSSACSFTGTGQDESLNTHSSPPQPETLRTETVLPGNFVAPQEPERCALLAIPPGILRLSKVAQRRAEIRLGPGGRFALRDQILPKGAQVIVFQRIGPWQQVLVPGSWVQGWIHAAALTPLALNAEPMVVDACKLPAVVALRPIRHVKNYQDTAPLPVAIPSGSRFHTLRTAQRSHLVWLAETNSVVWLPRKDAP